MKPIKVIEKLNESSIDFKNTENNNHRDYCKKSIDSLCKQYKVKPVYKEGTESHPGYGYQEKLDIKISLPDRELNYSILLPTWRKLSGHGVNKVHFSTDLRKDNKEIDGFNKWEHQDVKDAVDYLINIIEEDLRDNK